jgi:hypothetical protein
MSNLKSMGHWKTGANKTAGTAAKVQKTTTNRTAAGHTDTQTSWLEKGKSLRLSVLRLQNVQQRRKGEIIITEMRD